MNWVLVAFLSALLLAAQAAGLRTLAQLHAVAGYMAIIWVTAGVLVVCVGLTWGSAPAVNRNFWYVIPAAVSSWGAMYAYNLALKSIDNPGNADAISSLRTPLVYVVELMMDTSRFQYPRMLGVLLSVVCVALLATRHNVHASGFRFRSRAWVTWSCISAAGFACLILFSVGAIRHGNDVALTTGAVLVGAGLLFALQTAWASGIRGLMAPLRTSQAVIGCTIVVAAMGNLALIYASARSPNAGYATAVSSTRAGVLYLAWIATRRVRFDALATVAIVGMIASVALTAV